MEEIGFGDIAAADGRKVKRKRGKKTTTLDADRIETAQKTVMEEADGSNTTSNVIQDHYLGEEHEEISEVGYGHKEQQEVLAMTDDQKEILSNEKLPTSKADDRDNMDMDASDLNDGMCESANAVQFVDAFMKESIATLECVDNLESMKVEPTTVENDAVDDSAANSTIEDATLTSKNIHKV